MAGKQEISPRATLPGTIYRKNGYWWWKVRLPGQDRIRCRSLREPGARVGTKSRKKAGQIALALWEEALKAEVKAELEYQVTAPCHDQAPEAPDRSEFPSCEPKTSHIDKKTDEPLPAQPKATLPAHDPVSVISPATLVQSDWFDSLYETDDHALCDCCGRQDFFEEYLKQIDSGQRLCPRCYGEFQKKARPARKLQYV